MLPQRRKTPEEIARLRESMGIPGEAPPPPDLEPAVPDPEPAAPVAVAPVQAAAPGPDLRSSDVEVPRRKVVRSLRKSERLPPPEDRPKRLTAAASPGAPIPVSRHSDQELMTLRRQAAAPPDRAIALVQNQAVRTRMLALMYVLMLVAALVGWGSKAVANVSAFSFPAPWMADAAESPVTPVVGEVIMILLSAIALGIAGWIALKKPRSRHHAGFVTIIAVLVLAFGIIYHLPVPHGP